MAADDSGFTRLLAGADEAIAVVDNAASYTYGELRGRVGYAAALLHQQGMSPGGTVLIVAPNRREAVVGYLAGLVCGAKVVLVDRRAGDRDIAWAISVTRPGLLVCDPGDHVWTPSDVPVLAPGDIADGERDFADPPEHSGSDDAVIVFTSGTSSRPKGVRHSLSSLAAGTRNFQQVVGFSSGDTAILVSPLASITGVLQTHLALTNGGGLVLEDAFDPALTLARAIDNGATVFGGVPFVLEQLLEQARLGGLTRLPLRAAAIGGATIPRELLEEAARSYGILPSRIYGSSECPVSFGSAPADALESRLADEGVALPAVAGRIDPSNGELQISGPHVFAGYVDESDSAGAFTPDGWFRTGDLAELTRDRLTVTGRLKEVVVRKGMKISMAEVDSLLRGMPGVVEAATFAQPDPETGERLAVAVHVRRGADIGLADVTGWLMSAGLAKWKLPEHLVAWSQPLPRTETGKVLRRALAIDPGDRSARR